MRPTHNNQISQDMYVFVDDAISRLVLSRGFRSSTAWPIHLTGRCDPVAPGLDTLRDRPWARMKQALVGALCVMVLDPVAARAETIRLTCARENTTAPGWTGPLTVTFEGNPNGTLVVRSAHTQLDLRGSMETSAEDKSKRI